MLVLALWMAAHAEEPGLPAEATPVEAAPVEAAPVETAVAPVEAPQPATAEEWLDEAWRRIEANDPEGARIAAEQAASRDASVYPRARAAMGAAEETAGHPERAVPLYEEALALDPTLAGHLHLRLAEAHGALGDTKVAMSWLDELMPAERWPRADEMKIRLLHGVWTLESGKREPGRRELAAALGGMAEDEIPFYQARARAAIARDLCAEAEDLELKGSQKKQVARLEERAAVLQAADQQVAAALNLKEPAWGLDGLLTLARSYEALGDELAAVPPPRALRDPELKAAYEEQMAPYVQTLWVKAARYAGEGADLAVRLRWPGTKGAELEAARREIEAKVSDGS